VEVRKSSGEGPKFLKEETSRKAYEKATVLTRYIARHYPLHHQRSLSENIKEGKDQKRGTQASKASRPKKTKKAQALH